MLFELIAIAWIMATPVQTGWRLPVTIEAAKDVAARCTHLEAHS
jgi:hypothetical protein